MPNEYDGSYFSLDQLPMPALHKPYLSRVRKPLGSYGMLRRHDKQGFPSWRKFDLYSYIESDIASGSNDLPVSLFPDSSASVPHEYLPEATPTWDLTSPTVGIPKNKHQSDLFTRSLKPTQRPIGSNFLESESYLSGEFPFFDTFAKTSLSNGSSELLPDGVDSSIPFADPHYISEEDLTGASSTNMQEGPDRGQESQLISSSIWGSKSSYNIQKRLLELNLALIEDLEHLEWDSTVPSSMHFAGEDMTFSVSKLDVPVFRMLEHSAKLLEIINPRTFFSEAWTALSSSSEHPRIYSDNITQSPSRLFFKEAMEDGIATVASLDSGYMTAEVSPRYTSQILPPKHTLPVILSILTTYCHLVRLYHAAFTQLYQMFLILPPSEDSRFLVLPSSQYGNMGMDGKLSAQVQALVELSFNMLTKLENALELQSECYSESDRPSSHCASVLDPAPLAAIWGHIAAHEGIISGIPLKETMTCLSQLVKVSER